MAILKPAPVSAAQFHVQGDTLVGEISSTNGFGRVYDDACDEGLTVVDPVNGGELVFVVDSEGYRDGELVSWTLIPAELSKRGLANMTLFND